MKHDLLDILPKFSQYEDIPYSAGLNCTECGKADMAAYSEMDDYGISQHIKPIAVGWCDTPSGFMGIFECPECHSKFRFHCGGGIADDIDKFEFKFYQWIFMCENFPEIRKKLDELKEKRKKEEK